MLRRALLIVAGLAAPAIMAGAGVCIAVEVRIELPSPARIDTTGIKRILVGGFRVSDHPTVDLGREVNRLLRDMLGKDTDFEIINAEPLPLPEQPVEEAVRNTAYWKRLGTRFNADLILGGTFEFEERDESGFVQEDIISELTGQRYRRSRWVEREAFKMDMGLYMFRGTSGELVFEDHFAEGNTFPGKGNDALSVLHDLMERIRENVVGIVMPRTRLETRYLLTE